MFSTGKPVMCAQEKEVKMYRTSKSQDLEAVTTKVLKRITTEPAYRIILYKILEYCNPARPISDVERTILSFPEMRSAMHSPQILLSWLENAGAIEQLDDAENGEGMWGTTPAGLNAVRIESFDNGLKRLLVQEPSFQDVYQQILRACQSPKSRIELESLLKNNPVLEESHVLPSFFIEKLEAVGGIEWNEKWRTTSVGKDYLNAQEKFQT